MALTKTDQYWLKSGASIECPNCEGTQFSLTLDTQVRAQGVSDGRLRSNEVHAIIVLGCDECSETLEVFDGVETLPMSLLPFLLDVS